MKLTKFLAFMMALMMSCCFLTSCGDDEDEPEPENPSSALIGTWTQTNDYGTVISVTFFEGGRGRINFTYSDGSGDSNENFEYDYAAIDRQLDVIGSSLEGSYEVVITATTLQLSGYNYNDGDYVVYRFKKL